MNRVLIIIPADIYKLRYSHVFDFIHEYQRRFEVEILIIPERGYSIETYIERIKKTFYTKNTIKEIANFIRFFFLLFGKDKNNYEYVFSIDNLSYIFACRFLKNKNNVLWSLDFVSEDNESHKNYYAKKIQHYTREYLLRHKKIIIQSNKRLRLFLKSINIGVPESDNLVVRYLPVSLIDIPLADSRRPDRTTNNDITLIQIGGINQTRSNSCDLIAEFQKIDALRLILHGFISSEVTGFIFENKFLKMPILSNIDLPADMIVKMLSNADIGFISYVANDENFVNIDWASAQIAEHLRAGLPVICHGNTTLNAFVVEHNIGIGITDMKDLHNAIKILIGDYNAYSSRSRKLFEETMNISRLLPINFN